MIELTPGNEIPKLIDIEIMFKDQEYEKSLNTFEKLVGMDPEIQKLLLVY